MVVYKPPLTVARFHTPQTPVFDSHGNAYIADLGNHRVRKISVDGIVSTFAGSTAGYRNGLGTNAQFYTVQSVCVDGSDNIYVADWDNICIRKITPDGEVTLFAGQPSVRGRQDGPRLEATFETPGHMAFVIDSIGCGLKQAEGIGNCVDLLPAITRGSHGERSNGGDCRMNRRHFLSALRYGIRVETPAEFLAAVKGKRAP